MCTPADWTNTGNPQRPRWIFMPHYYIRICAHHGVWVPHYNICCRAHHSAFYFHRCTHCLVVSFPLQRHQKADIRQQVPQGRQPALLVDGVCIFQVDSNVPEFKDLKKHLVARKDDILAYFDYRYTNAFTESANNIIKTIEKQGHGYSFEVLRAMCLMSVNHIPSKVYIWKGAASEEDFIESWQF